MSNAKRPGDPPDGVAPELGEEAGVPPTADVEAIEHAAEQRDRLRRRFRDGGADGLPDDEILELILQRS